MRNAWPPIGTSDGSMIQTVFPSAVLCGWSVRQPSWIAAETAIAFSSVTADCMSSIRDTFTR